MTIEPVTLNSGKRAEKIDQLLSDGYKFIGNKLTVGPGKYSFITPNDDVICAVIVIAVKKYFLPIVTGTLIGKEHDTKNIRVHYNLTAKIGNFFVVSYDQFINIEPNQSYDVVINEKSQIEPLSLVEWEPDDDEIQDKLNDNTPRNIEEELISKKDYNHQNLPNTKTSNGINDIFSQSSVATKVLSNEEDIGVSSDLVYTLDDANEKQAQWAKLSKLVLLEIGNCKESNVMGVYVIHCQRDDNFYIGSTINLLKRKKQHLHNLNRNKHHSYKLQDTYDKYGCDCLKFYSLKLEPISPYLLQNKTASELHTYILKNLKHEEQYYIDEFSPFFNVDQDSRGTHHWEDNSKYKSW